MLNVRRCRSRNSRYASDAAMGLALQEAVAFFREDEKVSAALWA
jgi:hypothetical protein